VIDVVNNQLLGQLPMPTVCDTSVSPPDCGIEQPRFNPVDNMIYQNLSADSKVLRIDPTKGSPGADGQPLGAVVDTFDVAPCHPNGIDIDAVNNTALLGCNSSNTTPMTLLDLSTGKTIAVSGPNVDGADGLYFNPNLARFYTANQSNRRATSPTCPSRPPPNDTQHPVLGVFQAGPGTTKAATGLGAPCTGDGGHALGVDPIGNQIYVPVTHFPANAGPPGVLIFHDSSHPAQRALQRAEADLRPLTAGGSLGQVDFTRAGSTYQVTASLRQLPHATEVHLVVTTTVGNEVVRCRDRDPRDRDRHPEDAVCQGRVIGAPLVSGWATLAVEGSPAARGQIKRADGDGGPDDR
jgi:hypothetical protein